MSFFTSGVVGLSFFPSGGKGGAAGVSFLSFTVEVEVVFDLFPTDPSGGISHSPAPFTGGKVGFFSPATGAAGLLGVAGL